MDVLCPVASYIHKSNELDMELDKNVVYVVFIQHIDPKIVNDVRIITKRELSALEYIDTLQTVYHKIVAKVGCNNCEKFECSWRYEKRDLSKFMPIGSVILLDFYYANGIINSDDNDLDENISQKIKKSHHPWLLAPNDNQYIHVEKNTCLMQ